MIVAIMLGKTILSLISTVARHKVAMTSDDKLFVTHRANYLRFCCLVFQVAIYYFYSKINKLIIQDLCINQQL